MKDYRKAAVTPEIMELLSFAENVTRDARRISSDDIARLRAAGFPDRAILDAAHIAGFFCYMNRVVQALGADTRPDVGDTVGEKLRKIMVSKPLQI